MGYKSLAQMPALRNCPVSSNVRPHQRHAYSLPVNPRRSCGTHNNTPCTSDVSSGIFIFYALSIHFKRLESIVKLCFRRGLTTRSTGHFTACQVWAKIRAQTRHAAKCRLTFTLAITVEIRSDLNVCNCKFTRNPNSLSHQTRRGKTPVRHWRFAKSRRKASSAIQAPR